MDKSGRLASNLDLASRYHLELFPIIEIERMFAAVSVSGSY